MPTAIFVDAGFFLKRFPLVYRDKDKNDPTLVAKTLHEMALDHLTQPGDDERKELYRIFVYDCPPLTDKAHDPISGEAIDFSKTPESTFRSGFHQELTRLRKVVLRLGRLHSGGWRIRRFPLEELLAGSLQLDAVTKDHFDYDVVQKGVEMKIGLDIASVAYKRQADQIVLVAGDEDLVHAAKLARREGIDFILDPMWSDIASELHNQIDGLRSTCPRPLTFKEKLEQKKKMKELAKTQEASRASATTPAAEPSDTGKISRLFK